MRIRGYELDINFEEELEMYLDRFHMQRLRGCKLQACSPFRDERHPSFAVNLENGLWVDSGATEQRERKGNFVSLLSFLRGEVYEQTEEYLLEKYLHILDDVESLKLDLQLDMGDAVEFHLDIKDKYSLGEYSNYLAGRGIGEEVQSLFGVGENVDRGFISLPWRDGNGDIINIKFRSTTKKDFWYTSNGKLINSYLFGYDLIKQRGYLDSTIIAIVESEIDCMYMWECGIPCVAVGGSSLTDKQLTLLRGLGVGGLLIATDNDKVGNWFASCISNEMMGYTTCYRFKFKDGVKDVNEMTPEEVQKGFAEKETITIKW